MTVSLSGLDMPWLKETRVQRGRFRYDPETKAVIPAAEFASKYPDRKKRGSVAAPFFMNDIKPFVNIATREGGEITSRSQLREFEKRTNMRQVGNDFETGSIAAANEAKKAEWERLASTVEHGWTDPD